MSKMITVLISLVVALHLDSGHGQTLPNRRGCPACPPCPTLPPPTTAPPNPAPGPGAAASAGKSFTQPQPSPERFVCECNFNVLSTCGTQNDGSCVWRLAFKAIKGNQRIVYQDFLDNSLINPDSSVAATIYDNTEPYKNKILMEWDQYHVEQVRVDLFNNGERKAWLLFDAHETTRSDWFSQNRLLDSSFNNTKPPAVFTYFSAEGKDSEHIRFHIGDSEDICSEDCGYIAVVDTGAYRCPWQRIQPHPYFMYGGQDGNCCKWNKATNCGEVKADIVFVIDASGSIGPTEFEQLKTFVFNVVEAFPAGEDKTRFGAILFSSGVQTSFKLDEFFTQAEIQAKIQTINKLGGATRTDLALRYLKDVAFAPGNGARPLVPKVGFVLTDGASSHPVDTVDAINYIQPDGYTIYSVGIGTALNIDELNAIASDPDSTYSLLSSFDKLDELLDPLITSACKTFAPKKSARGTAPEPSEGKVADVFAISVKTCDFGHGIGP